MLKLNARINRMQDTVYININKREVGKLLYNHIGITTLKITRWNALFCFESKFKDELDLIDNEIKNVWSKTS